MLTYCTLILCENPMKNVSLRSHNRRTENKETHSSASFKKTITPKPGKKAQKESHERHNLCFCVHPTMPLVPIAKHLFQRRRHKRSRRQDPDDNPKPSKSPRSRSANFNFDDSSFAFLDSSSGHALSDGKSVSSCILKLVEERRIGKWEHKKRSWEMEALTSFTKRPSSKADHRRKWRPMAKRSIPFIHLGTPPSEAILALDRTGSYVLSLGARDDKNDAPLALALRFFGVPSPSCLQGRNDKKSQKITSPLLQTTPLLYDLPNDESLEDSVFNFRRNVSPATTPVKLLISNDWRVGVAMFQPSTVWTEEGPVGNLVLFSLPDPNVHHNTHSIFQCSNVRLGANSSFSARNLLWRVQYVPQKEGNESLGCVFDSYVGVPGYLFFNDEEDGFRLTWVIDKWNLDESTCRNKIISPPFAKRSEAAVISAQKTWEEIPYEKYNGKRVVQENNAKNQSLRVVSEAFLQVDTLLGAILDGRKGISEVHPEFHYNLISVQANGRVAELIVAFVRKRKPGSLGVFVRVDLFTGHYFEQDWVKSLGTRDATSLRDWCNTLALNRRMKQKRSGPYSIDRKHTIDWSRLCVESGFDPDEEDDYEPEFWREYVASAESLLTSTAPKLISLSSLYSDCDLISNKAITSCLPVASLKSKNSATELVYRSDQH